MTVILHALLLEIPEMVESERLTLVAARAGQGAAMNEAIVESHARLKDWMPWAQKVPSVEESEVYCREAQAKWLSRQMLDFCMMRRGDGRLVGKAGLHSIDWSLPRFEIGYWVRTSCARQGYATEAARALSRLAAEKLGAHRVEIRCDSRNAASRRVAEKCGFALEGILHASRRDVVGALADSCVYARVF